MSTTQDFQKILHQKLTSGLDTSQIPQLKNFIANKQILSVAFCLLDFQSQKNLGVIKWDNPHAASTEQAIDNFVEARDAEQQIADKSITALLTRFNGSELKDSFFVVTAQDQNQILKKFNSQGNFEYSLPPDYYLVHSKLNDLSARIDHQKEIMRDVSSQISCGLKTLYFPVTVQVAKNQEPRLLYILVCIIDESIDNQTILSIINLSLSLVKDSVFEHCVIALMADFLKSCCSSAIGSIMSRNGSHNIGSHVLAALTHNVGTMPDDRILYQYIQHRMDYIAQVCTEHPTWTQPIMFVGDIMKNFFAQRHLLDYISRSEGLSSYHFQDSNMSEKERLEQQGKIKLFIRRYYRTMPEKEEFNHPAWSKTPASPDSTSDNLYAKHILGLRYDSNHKTYNFIDYHTGEDTIDWEKDIQLAIPGGAVGSHAFYTIIENIIRNAAKHGWMATQNADTKNKPQNLEIYIDFENKDDTAEVEFTIWDNVSNVFAPVFASWNQSLPNKISALSANPNKLTDCIAPLKKDDLTKIKEYIKPTTEQIASVPIPLHWAQQIKLNEPFITGQGALRREDWGMAEMRISVGFLQQRSIEEIGGLKDLDPGKPIITPVAMPGICQCPHNRNGGINCHGTCDTPNEKCPQKNQTYHLGYRFTVKKTKEILIVLTEETKRNKLELLTPHLATLKKHGVYFATRENTTFQLVSEESVSEKILNFGFEYVVLDALPENIFHEIRTGEKLRFPFRVLTQTKKDSRLLIPFCNLGSPKATDELTISQDEREQFEHLKSKFCPNCSIKENTLAREQQATTQEDKKCSNYAYTNLGELLHDLSDQGVLNKYTTDKQAPEEILINAFKCHIYDTWIDSLRERAIKLNEPNEGEVNTRGKTQIDIPPKENGPLKIYLDTVGGESDSGRGLISDNEVWKYFFEHRFRALVGEFITRHAEDSDVRQYLPTFIAMYFDHLTSKSSFETKYVQMNPLECTDESYLRDIDLEGKVKQVFRQIKNNDPQTPSYAWGNLVFNHPEISLDLIYKLPFSLYKKFESYLIVAFNVTDGLLRKYEEKISTLPQGYATKGYRKETANLQSNLQTVQFAKTQEESEIFYYRHGAGPKAIYSEGLSGAQSYLNLLVKMQEKGNDALLAKMAENALMQVLIADERMCDFFTSHQDCIQNFSKMNLWGLDVKNAKEDNDRSWTKANHSTVTSLSFDLDQMLNAIEQTNGEQGKITTYLSNIADKFDIFIIHQGLLDKWLTDRNISVADFLKGMKKYFSYVVVTTGRGKPANIPKDARVIPFACIENFLFQRYPEKLLLVDTIMNLLPYGESNDNT